MLFRPVKESDLNDLLNLAESAGTGMTTLPNDEEYHKDRIVQSLKAFDERIKKPGGEKYLFVLEDSKTGRVIGTSSIISKLGGFEPFFTYKIKSEHSSDPNLEVEKDIKTLHLVENHSGPTEICSLFLKPDQRKAGQGYLLSLARFLFMKVFENRFDKTVISELRGISDSAGKSPFWECVGRHFFDCDFSKADLLSGLGKKNFIKNLMPHYPIYIAMLPKDVQDIIGEVHDNTKPALKLLEREGFRFNNEVDIFDAGPTVSAKTKAIRSISEARILKVNTLSTEVIDSEEYIVSNKSLDFRATFANVTSDGDQATISESTADLLNLKIGDEILIVTRK